MKKGIVYLLMGIFLLFTVENRQTLDFQQDFGSQNISFQFFSFAKKHHRNHALERNSLQQISDSLDAPEEFDLGLSNAFSAIAVLAVFGFGYLLHWYFRRTKQKFHEPATIIYAIKRFILLRSIRI
ncbi:hypothetical protein [Epilithonimonas tenax]|uniref:hypothetical protein n=1 Tax=Epilithonimonas tenax TaxID=191577 RepID=UPI00040B9B19|nr:hypothetical protein [Epilithonimonas tenax]